MAASESHPAHVQLEVNSTDDEITRPIFNVLKATLECPASRQMKSKKLTIDILSFCVASEDSPATFFDIWPVFLDIVASIPPNHEWQLCLGDVLDLLRQDLDRLIGSDGTFFTSSERATLRSADWLFELEMAIVEYWNGFANPSTFGDAAPHPEALEQWQKFNSFFARYSRRGHPLALRSGVGAIQDALEEPPVNNSFSDPLVGSKIWVATEWLTQCGSLIYKELREPQGHQCGGTGSLCKDLHPHSVERWHFWEQRLLKVRGRSLRMVRGFSRLLRP